MSPGRERAERPARTRLVLCGLLLLAPLLSGCGEKPLTTVSSEQEAVEIITTLREGGVKAEKHEAGEASARRWNIVVGGADYDFANQLLRYYELPRAEEKLPEASPFQSESERRARQLREARVQIEQHLRKLIGVARVSVLISPPDDEVRTKPSPAKADVTITHKDARPPVTVEEIQQKVASSYPTLTPESVSVKLQHEPPPSPPPRQPPLDGRGYTVFAAGLATVAALTGLLFMLLRKRRSQRARQASAAQPPEPDGGDDEEEEQEKPHMLAPTTRPDV